MATTRKTTTAQDDEHQKALQKIAALEKQLLDSKTEIKKLKAEVKKKQRKSALMNDKVLEVLECVFPGIDTTKLR